MNAKQSWFLAAVLCGAVLTTGCGDSGDCADGADNDADGLIDGDDIACAAGQDNEAPDPVLPECSDGVDNDEDGTSDGDDPGCTGTEDDDETNETIAECKDGIDNDGDGLVDSPNDPGCELSLDNDESDACPDGEGCPACSNGADDDGDGAADFPNDPGCDSAADQDEFNSVSGVCGNAPVQNLPASGMATGMIEAGGTNVLASPECSGTGGEVVYQFTIDAARAAEFTTDFPETTLDTVLYLRSDCMDPDTELTCNDDAVSGTTFGSSIVVPDLQPGTYYLVVDGRSNGSQGEYRLQSNLFTGAGAPCEAAANECPPGYMCQRATSTAAEDTCELPRCADGRDFDGDGKADFPDEPGCASAADNDESDDCPGGGECPDCSNGQDDDDDGQTDYPADAACASAASDAEILLCAEETSPVLDIVGPATNGTTVGAGDELEGGCGSDDANDVVFRLTVPGDLTTLHLDTIGSQISDTTLYLRSDSCTAADLACNDDGAGLLSVIDQPNVPAGTYFVVVAAYSSSTSDAPFVLNVSGTIATGQPCSGNLFTCVGGGACTGGTCQAP